MGVRMVPIATLFGRFRRLIHDLSRDLGKPIELVTAGEDTELDKTMIERLADPLVHLIRNAADHGVETPERRAAAGKPATGRIALTSRACGRAGARHRARRRRRARQPPASAPRRRSRGCCSPAPP